MLDATMYYSNSKPITFPVMPNVVINSINGVSTPTVINSGSNDMRTSQTRTKNGVMSQVMLLIDGSEHIVYEHTDAISASLSDTERVEACNQARNKAIEVVVAGLREAL